MIGFSPSPEEVGERVDVVVTKRSGRPRKLCQEAIRLGEVTVNDNQVRPSYRLDDQDVVAGEVIERTAAGPQAEDIPLHIVWEDERAMVISKPAGLVTHPAHGHTEGTLVSALLNSGRPLADPGSIRPGLVHRLDKDTSGLLVIAKDDDARDALVEGIKERTVERRYRALVRGELSSASGTVDAAIGRHPQRRTVMAVVADGKPAVTHFQVLTSTGAASLLDVRLETGRTHQIRVHLAHLGHPVLGDGTYGGRSELSRSLGLERPFLHAWRLAFPHPTDGHLVEVEDPLPEDLASALAKAGIPPPE
ncbi:MAG: rRNA synthase [Actinomycetota bacterium]|jgi:23S rRNA pseudouridine1911/1915/1917 synthase|nr:rRNA synthase [Actinomycetota bacterium]